MQRWASVLIEESRIILFLIPFAAGEPKVRPTVMKLITRRSRSTRDRPRRNGKPVINPNDLEDSHDSRHRRIYPLALPPLEHLMKLGMAAKVVPNLPRGRRPQTVESWSSAGSKCRVSPSPHNHRA